MFLLRILLKQNEKLHRIPSVSWVIFANMNQTSARFKDLILPRITSLLSVRSRRKTIISSVWQNMEF